MEKSAPEITGPGPDSRREFLKHLLSGAATATVLMVYGPGVLGTALRTGQSRVWNERSTEHRWTYVIDISKCIGCGACVRACKRENNVPDKVFRTWVERYVLTDEGVYIDSPNGALEGFEEVNAEIRESALRTYFVPKMCNHCVDPPCVQVCPVGATYKDPEGFVLIDHEHCIGCAYCVQACPYAARFINPEIKKSDKCTWCYHRVKNGRLPACVEACPNRARLFGDMMDPESEVAKIFKEDKWMVLQPEMHTQPYCFYVGLPREVV